MICALLSITCLCSFLSICVLSYFLVPFSWAVYSDVYIFSIILNLDVDARQLVNFPHHYVEEFKAFEILVMYLDGEKARTFQIRDSFKYDLKKWMNVFMIYSLLCSCFEDVDDELVVLWAASHRGWGWGCVVLKACPACLPSRQQLNPTHSTRAKLKNAQFQHRNAGQRRARPTRTKSEEVVGGVFFFFFHCDVATCHSHTSSYRTYGCVHRWWDWSCRTTAGSREFCWFLAWSLLVAVPVLVLVLGCVAAADAEREARSPSLRQDAGVGGSGVTVFTGTLVTWLGESERERGQKVVVFFT